MCRRPLWIPYEETAIFTYKNRHGIKVHMSVAAYLNFPTRIAPWIPKTGKDISFPVTTTGFPYKFCKKLLSTNVVTFYINIIADYVKILNLIYMERLWKRFTVTLLRSRQCQCNFAYFGLNYLFSFTAFEDRTEFSQSLCLIYCLPSLSCIYLKLILVYYIY